MKGGSKALDLKNEQNGSGRLVIINWGKGSHHLHLIPDSYPASSVDDYEIDADFAIVAYGYDG